MAILDALVAAEVVLVPELEAVDPDAEDPALGVPELDGAEVGEDDDGAAVVVVVGVGLGVFFLWCFFFRDRGDVGGVAVVGVVEVDSETNSEVPCGLVRRLAVVDEDDPVEDVPVVEFSAACS